MVWNTATYFTIHNYYYFLLSLMISHVFKTYKAFLILYHPYYGNIIFLSFNVILQEFISDVIAFVIIPFVMILRNQTMKKYAKHWLEFKRDQFRANCKPKLTEKVFLTKQPNCVSPQVNPA
jgi:hypothetical protein